MTNTPLITVNVVVYNGEKYLRHCLRAVQAQTYKNLQVQVFDNASTDQTNDIVRNEFPEFTLITNQKNLGMWPGQEEALKTSNGKYVVALSVDVMLHPGFIEKAVTRSEQLPQLGALQAKILSYNYDDLVQGTYTQSRTIDTCGFRVERSRRVTNVGHGEPDTDNSLHPRTIFAVEGAVPFFRREALEDIRLQGELIDRDYFWYGDDLDLGWRMHLLGWEQWYDPAVVAYHDRSTTKGHSKNMHDYITRVSLRQQIPQEKRILDWSNVGFTIVKNDYIINVLKDLPFIALRQVQIVGYWLLFEPKTFAAIPRFLSLLPKMLAKRKLVMARALVPPNRMHQWIR